MQYRHRPLGICGLLVEKYWPMWPIEVGTQNCVVKILVSTCSYDHFVLHSSIQTCDIQLPPQQMFASLNVHKYYSWIFWVYLCHLHVYAHPILHQGDWHWGKVSFQSYTATPETQGTHCWWNLFMPKTPLRPLPGCNQPREHKDFKGPILCKTHFFMAFLKKKKKPSRPLYRRPSCEDKKHLFFLDPAIR